jgi:DNA-binding transcriptional regulator YdaS (Cro superfamily)
MKSVVEQVAEVERHMLHSAIAWAGSQANLSRFLDVSPQTVLQWIERGRISATAAVKLEEVSKGMFKADEMRPDVVTWWHKHGKATQQ